MAFKASVEDSACMEKNPQAVMRIDREIALAAAAALQPNFSSKSVTKQQLAQLQALRRRRLLLQNKESEPLSQKTASQCQNKADNNKCSSIFGTNDHVNKLADVSFSTKIGIPDSARKVEEIINHRWKKRQKLQWGLDTKERWERKGNM